MASNCNFSEREEAATAESIRPQKLKLLVIYLRCFENSKREDIISFGKNIRDQENELRAIEDLRKSTSIKELLKDPSLTVTLTEVYDNRIKYLNEGIKSLKRNTLDYIDDAIKRLKTNNLEDETTKVEE